MQTENETPIKDKHLLVAVDQTDNSKRAVLYVADFLGGFPGFRVTLLSIVPEPEADFFDTEAEKDAWTLKKMEEADKMLRNYRQILIQSGFPADKVQVRSCVNERKALSEAILQSQCGLSCCTVVVGRHHKSKSEEFLFGSTSNKIIHEAKNCAVWVVE
jgi:nucleotide-binding universal stress UspA family protein